VGRPRHSQLPRPLGSLLAGPCDSSIESYQPSEPVVVAPYSLFAVGCHFHGIGTPSAAVRQATQATHAAGGTHVAECPRHHGNRECQPSLNGARRARKSVNGTRRGPDERKRCPAGPDERKRCPAGPDERKRCPADLGTPPSARRRYDPDLGEQQSEARTPQSGDARESAAITYGRPRCRDPAEL
jgi:hypothetical protein